MRLSAAQRRILANLDGEEPRRLLATQRRSALILKNMGMIEYATNGWRLTKRGLEVELDRLLPPIQEG